MLFVRCCGCADITSGSGASVKLSTPGNAFLRFISRANSAAVGLHLDCASTKIYLQRPSTLPSHVGVGDLSEADEEGCG
jgi:hypothetical protein